MRQRLLWGAQGHPRPEPDSLPSSLPTGGTGTRDPRGLTGFRGISVDRISGHIHFLHPCVLPAGQSPHGRAGAQRPGGGGDSSRPGPGRGPGAGLAAAPARSILRSARLRSAPRPAPPPRHRGAATLGAGPPSAGTPRPAPALCWVRGRDAAAASPDHTAPVTLTHLPSEVPSQVPFTCPRAVAPTVPPTCHTPCHPVPLSGPPCHHLPP